jgi:hypothetical protein
MFVVALIFWGRFNVSVKKPALKFTVVNHAFDPLKSIPFKCTSGKVWPYIRYVLYRSFMEVE